MTNTGAERTVGSVEGLYEEALAARRARLAQLERSHVRLSQLRLVSVGAAVVILMVGGLSAAAWLALPISAFVGLAIVHSRVLADKSRRQSAITFYQRGLARIRHQWIGTGRSGEDHRPAEHLYAHDLDIFGRGSLFELLATTRTKAGEDTLASWLLNIATPATARERQGAVEELAHRLDLRESVAVLGDQVRVAVDAPVLRAWASSPLRLAGSEARVALALLALATCATLVWWIWTGTLGTVALVLVLGQGLVAWALQARVRTVIASVDDPSHDLDVLVDLLAILEGERFASPRLEQLRRTLGEGDVASREIARLSQLVAMLASRRNFMFAFPAALMLWGTQWAFAIEAWRARAGVHIPRWLDAIGEFEALLALGGFAAEHPSHVYPAIVDDGPVVVGEKLAHPALGSAAVANSVSMGGDGLRLLVISGSNMSGKSTWLRTIGTSVVLAAMGAPLRAERVELSLPLVGAAIRVEDSLTEGKSRFFAEITRLKEIVDATRARRGQVLFLLDEILAGTNSHDRRVGAEALIRSLVASGAVGLVTTHDLALGEIVHRLPGQSANAHFEDEFVDGVLRFDYTLKPGIVQTSNALELMRSIGLDV